MDFLVTSQEPRRVNSYASLALCVLKYIKLSQQCDLLIIMSALGAASLIVSRRYIISSFASRVQASKKL
jgi:hypothetical protein